MLLGCKNLLETSETQILPNVKIPKAKINHKIRVKLEKETNRGTNKNVTQNKTTARRSSSRLKSCNPSNTQVSKPQTSNEQQSEPTNETSIGFGSYETAKELLCRTVNLIGELTEFKKLLESMYMYTV